MINFKLALYSCRADWSILGKFKDICSVNILKSRIDTDTFKCTWMSLLNYFITYQHCNPVLNATPLMFVKQIKTEIQTEMINDYATFSQLLLGYISILRF